MDGEHYIMSISIIYPLKFYYDDQLKDGEMDEMWKLRDAYEVSVGSLEWSLGDLTMHRSKYNIALDLQDE